jgi:hypothetical protein
VIARFHDYQLTVASVPVGGTAEIPLQLDTDAPFLLHLVRSRSIGVSGWRFQTPKKLWQSSGLRTDLIVPSVAGALATPSRGAIVDPPYVYPIGSQIVAQIGNATNAPLVNAKLLFRGFKIFQDGAILAPTYPPRMSVLPFNYGVVVPAVPAVGRLVDQQLQIRADADFVFKYGVCDPYTPGVDGGPVTGIGLPSVVAVNPTFGTYQELYVVLRDESRKAYSNEPIHINDVFGQGLPTTGNDAQVSFFPGLTTPEIYIPAEHSLYFDLFRNDTALNMTPLDLNFRFGGMKVFKR